MTQISSESAEPVPMKLTFQGTHIFAGIRTLAELGLVDLKKMPSWMTGEDGMSSSIVRGGRVVGGKGGGA